jgi:hypothetical protein
MYHIKPNLYIGFHGCDEMIRNRLIMNPNHVEKSNRPYDWLGNGFYVWENNFSRAFPGTRSYLSYNVPSYKIKIGDFDDKNDANKFMRRLIAAFPAAFIVPDLVTIKNINVIQ